MLSKSLRGIAVLCLPLVMSACATQGPPKIGPSVEQIYNETSHRGARDTVQVVREGLRAQASAGTSDPAVPIRQPESVLPIWIPPYVDKATGRRVDGHWQYAVIEESQWQLDY